jgi:hypothetical protein
MRHLLCAIAATLCVNAPANAERFTNTALGLRIEKPDDWCVLTPEENAEDHRRIEAANPQLSEGIRGDGERPVYAFFRYRDRYRGGFTPTVKVGTRTAASLIGHTGQQVLDAMLPQVGKMMTGLTVVTAPESVRLAGKLAGHMTLTYTLNVDRTSFRVASEMWVIPRGTYFVVLGAIYPPDDKSGDRAAVMKIVNSLQLTD